VKSIYKAVYVFEKFCVSYEFKKNVFIEKRRKPMKINATMFSAAGKEKR